MSSIARMKLHTRTAALVSVLAASVALSACEGEVSIGGDSVSADDIETEAKSALTAKVGEAPESIDCPSDLDAKEGESETCTLTAKDGKTYDMTATVSSVDGDTTNLEFQVGDRTN